jgi:hypothetical protein
LKIPRPPRSTPSRRLAACRRHCPRGFANGPRCPRRDPLPCEFAARSIPPSCGVRCRCRSPAARATPVATVQGPGGVPVDLVLVGTTGRQNVYGEADDLLRPVLLPQHRVTHAGVVGARHPPPERLAHGAAYALRNLHGAAGAARIASVFTITTCVSRADLTSFAGDLLRGRLRFKPELRAEISPKLRRELTLAARADLGGILSGLNYDLYNPRTTAHSSI